MLKAFIAKLARLCAMPVMLIAFFTISNSALMSQTVTVTVNGEKEIDFDQIEVLVLFMMPYRRRASALRHIPWVVIGNIE